MYNAFYGSGGRGSFLKSEMLSGSSWRRPGYEIFITERPCNKLGAWSLKEVGIYQADRVKHNDMLMTGLWEMYDSSVFEP